MNLIEQLRKDFELNDLIFGEIKDQKLTYNKKLNCYTDLMGKYTHKANWINGAWFMFRELNKGK